MAVISFANLDQHFSIRDSAAAEFSSSDGAAIGFDYSYLTSGGHDWEFDGTGITTGGGLPTGGTVDAIQVDLDNDASGTPEIIVTGLGGVAATSFGIGIGTADQQRDAFWIAALSGADTFDFTMADYTIFIDISGDGAYINDGLDHTGANDMFVDGGSALLGNPSVTGDYYFVQSGSATGGDDTFTVGSPFISGDFHQAFGGAAFVVGGDDVIAPARLADGIVTFIELIGDVLGTTTVTTGGDDLIDLRQTDITGLTVAAILYGDVSFINPAGSLTGGDDTIHGSSNGDWIYGDYASNNGASAGGNDSLLGYDGSDTISGNEGVDFISGGDGADMLAGGAGADTLDGGAGADTADYSNAPSGVVVSLASGTGSGGEALNDVLISIEKLIGSPSGDSLSGGGGDEYIIGAGGADTLVGLSGDDTMRGDDGNDRIFSGLGDDRADGGLGDDFARTSNGRDTLLGGDGNDTLGAGSGNDLLNGGAGADLLLASNGNDRLLGGDGNDTMLGSGGRDTLTGGAGNDRLIGGSENDGFNFAPGSGADLIVDFGAGAASGDIIRLIGFGAAFDSFAEVLAVSTQVGANVVIDFGDGDMITLQGVTLGNLNAGDFAFG